MTGWAARTELARLRLQQRDGVTCGPSVAIVGAALLDSHYRGRLGDPTWFAAEQGRLHRRLNRFWPRMLGTTPVGVASALTEHSPAQYRWRRARGRRDGLCDVYEALLTGFPVAMLVGRFVPRHWVLLVDRDDGGFDCYEPSSGTLRRVDADAVRRGRLDGVGFPRAFCFVLPARR